MEKLKMESKYLQALTSIRYQAGDYTKTRKMVILK